MKHIHLAPKTTLEKSQREGFSIAKALCFPLLCWNWKSAILSAVIRSVVYMVATMKHGWHSSFYAVVSEMLYVALTAGIYSAMQQGALDLKPRWLSNGLIVIGVPAFSQTVEYMIHAAAGTPNLKAATISILCFGLISATFHLYIMRRGAMLVGEKSRPFSDDLKRMPALVGSFLAAPFLAAMEATRRPWGDDEAAA